MAKKAWIERNKRKAETVKKYAAIRAELKAKRDYAGLSKLPRIRDFRGLSPRKFDGRGNYTFGIAEQTIFPEIELDKIKRKQGMDITIVTSAPTDAEALDLLKLMGFPLAEAKETPQKGAKETKE